MNNENLNYNEIKRLERILDTKHQIHGKGNFPTIEVEPRNLIQDVYGRLTDAGIGIVDVRINGSAASHVISQDGMGYKDIDIIFKLELADAKSVDGSVHPASLRYDESVTCKTTPPRKKHNRARKFSKNRDDDIRWGVVRDTVMSVLLTQLPKDVRRDRLTTDVLLSAYVNKLIKINNDHDKWSLVSLSNNKGRNLELKFVESMRRQFEFSVDSFQIILNSYIQFASLSDVRISPSFFPAVQAESVYGSFENARQHLQNRFIVTRSPEEIRGGGLLRYCNLLTRNFTVRDTDDTSRLQSLMCSRFFIDFPDIESQTRKINSYLTNHFNSDDELELRFNFLLSLQSVVDDSTICLMSHERKQVLDLIVDLAKQTLANILQMEGFRIYEPSIESSENLARQHYPPPVPQVVPESKLTNETHGYPMPNMIVAHPYPVLPTVTYSTIDTQGITQEHSLHQANEMNSMYTDGRFYQTPYSESPSSSGLSSVNSDDSDVYNISRPSSVSSSVDSSSVKSNCSDTGSCVSESSGIVVSMKSSYSEISSPSPPLPSEVSSTVFTNEYPKYYQKYPTCNYPVIANH